VSVSALAASRLASPSFSGVGAARPLYYKNLSNAGIAALTAAEIGAMKSVEMAALSTNQIKAFDSQALASGLSTYFNNKQVLPTNFIASLGNNQIGQFGASLVSTILSSKTLNQMTTSQIGAISTSVVSGISTAALQNLSGAQLGGFSQSQASQLSTAQVGSLKSQQISAVPAAWLNKLSSVQIQSLGIASIGALTKAQIAGLDNAHVQYLSGPSKINLVFPKLSASQIGVINAPAVADISLDTLKKLSNDQLKGFTVDQFSHFTRENINWVVSTKLNIGFSIQQKDAIRARKAEPIKEWTQLLGSNSYDAAQALTTGRDGSIYVSGFTYGSPDGQTNSGSTDAFITKFDSNGRKGWTRVVGTSADDQVQGMTSAKDGAIYITGYTNGNLNGQTNGGGADAFITKFNPDGTQGWTKLLGTSSDDSAYAATTATDGSIYIAGYTNGNLNGQTNAGGADGFITKFNPDGTKGWTKLLGTSGDDYASSLTTGADGAIYAAGITFGGLNGQASIGSGDAFITKFNPNGDEQWTKLLGTNAYDAAYALTTGKDGSIYVSGGTYGSLDGQTNNSGGLDAYVTKFNPDGTKQGTKLLGTSSWNSAKALTVGADGSIYVGGFTYDPLRPDGSIVDAFVTKYSV